MSCLFLITAYMWGIFNRTRLFHFFNSFECLIHLCLGQTGSLLKVGQKQGAKHDSAVQLELARRQAGLTTKHFILRVSEVRILTWVCRSLHKPLTPSYWLALYMVICLFMPLSRCSLTRCWSFYRLCHGLLGWESQLVHFSFGTSSLVNVFCIGLLLLCISVSFHSFSILSRVNLTAESPLSHNS